MAHYTRRRTLTTSVLTYRIRTMFPSTSVSRWWTVTGSIMRWRTANDAISSLKFATLELSLVRK